LKYSTDQPCTMQTQLNSTQRASMDAGVKTPQTNLNLKQIGIW